MNTTQIQVGQESIAVSTYTAIVVGSGASGYNAAHRLHQSGVKDVAVVTEGINQGTSRNTGSDKQTYYKITLSGDTADSVADMANDLFAGQCMDGEHALCEAALSAQCFLKLVELGVPFPRNRYGEYIGYKTDHDPRKRATSVGPYTSKMMTEGLEKAVIDANILILDHLQVIRILSDDDGAFGVLCFNRQTQGHQIILCQYLVMATGGPAGMYADSVFPLGHFGSTGLAFEAGAKGKNLTEWQFGLASIKPRWNVSGTFMQALPRFISTDAEGNDPQEFLLDFFADRSELLSNVFLKGYQWPFDVRKVATGSSIVDLLVYQEQYLRGRRIFLDYRDNCAQEAVEFDKLQPEVRTYLEQGGACFGTPIERLLHMNTPCVDFYLEKGVDLRTELLEIALCAQHNNGGVAIDAWWQSHVKGLFVVGEAAGSHGVYRPGGSALNSGQVGSTRAAQFISVGAPVDPDAVYARLTQSMNAVETVLQREQAIQQGGAGNVMDLYRKTAQRMSQVGGCIRDKAGISQALSEVAEDLESFNQTVRVETPQQLAMAHRLHEIYICQYVYLSAMLDFANAGGGSRGSALYTDESGNLRDTRLPELFRFHLSKEDFGKRVQETAYTPIHCQYHWRDVHPIPTEDDFFENVWRAYREHKNIY